MVVEAPKKPKIPEGGPNKPSPVSSIAKIGSLKRFPDKDYALDLLHQLAIAVAPIIHEYKFKVGTLCEMYPKNPSLLGLNVNKGQKILIRLRLPFNDRLYYPMGDLIGTFLHELTHNVHGPHDAKFYALLDELKAKYESGPVSNDYVCEENRLGLGYRPNSTLKSMREKRLEALSKGTYRAEARRLGGAKVLPQDLRKVMLLAAERRLKDLKWCALGNLGDEDLGMTEVEQIPQASKDDATLTKASSTASKSSAAQSDTPSLKLKEYKEVIDLTLDEADDSGVEVVVVDACELNVDPSKLWASALQLAGNKDIHYKTSNPPGKTFIGEDCQYPRRKLVADLNFEQIIEKGHESETTVEKRRKDSLKKDGDHKRLASHSMAGSLQQLVKPIGDTAGQGTGNKPIVGNGRISDGGSHSLEKSGQKGAKNTPKKKRAPKSIEDSPKAEGLPKKPKDAQQVKRKPAKKAKPAAPRKEVRAVLFSELLH